MRRCAVGICKNNSKNSKHLGVTFHRFPLDTKRRKIWITRCRRGDQGFNPNNAVICSVHFSPDDFKRNLRAELLGLDKGRISLSETAIPKLKLGGPEVKVTKAQLDRAKRMKEKEKKEMIEKLLASKEQEKALLLSKNIKEAAAKPPEPPAKKTKNVPPKICNQKYTKQVASKSYLL